jgi:hypothetical protein
MQQKMQIVVDFLRKMNPVHIFFAGFPKPDFNFKGFFYDKEFVERSSADSYRFVDYAGRLQ